DAGAILIDGREVSIDSPRAALEHGIGTVYQHSTLIPALSVLENLMLGDTRTVRLDVAGARKRLAELGDQLVVEIVKALWRGSRVLVLDEPTSMLTPQAFAELEQVLSRLKDQGLGVVFISHK